MNAKPLAEYENGSAGCRSSPNTTFRYFAEHTKWYINIDIDIL